MTILENIGDFLGVARTQLSRAELAYNAYIKSGKTFLYAKILKVANDALRDLLVRNTHLLPIEQTTNALALIHHIDVWGAIWEESVASEKPSLMDVFTFENGVNFPREEVALLMEYYEKNFCKRQ